MSGAKLVDHERPRLGDDLKQHPHHIQSAPSFDPSDGLPRMTSAVTMTDSLAPTLDHETFVCMGDDRSFVIRDGWGEVLLMVHPDRVRRYRDTYRYVWVVTLSNAEQRAAGNPPPWAAAVGATDERAVDGHTHYFRVEPFRRQCEHYRRVMTDFEGQGDLRQVERVCAAQRTEGGEYVSLRDTRVYACEHRSPPDFVSLERLRSFDAERLRDAAKQTEEFDITAALAAENSKGESE